MKKTIIAIPADDSPRNTKFNQMFLRSLERFHQPKDIEVRMFPNTTNDPAYWYRATPIIACQLFDEGYERVIKMDNDQIITGSLEDILNDKDEYDVGVVFNDPSYPIQVWDITHSLYYNNGLVVINSKEFAEHWKRLCFTPHFNNYQYREQDLLTLLCSDYFNYTIKHLESLKVYGEWAKPNWINCYIKDNKIMFPINGQEIQLCIIHFGGGNTPDKGNYRIRFQSEVVAFIDKLIK